MKALIVTNMWPSEADPVFGIFVRQQVEDLRRTDPDLDVEVFAFDGRRSKLEYLRAILRLRRLLASRRGERSEYGERSEEQVAQATFDIIHAHYVLSGLVALLAGARRHAPLVVTHHGIEVFEGWQAPLARWVSRRADKTLVISQAMARHLGLGADAVLPCGIDLGRFQPGSREEARAELGLPSSPVPLVAWVGEDRPEKRLWLARASVEALRDWLPDAELHVVEGQAPESVPMHLRAADVVLVTSTREGGPLVVKEALSVGRPVVSVAVGDVVEVLAGVDACHVVPNAPELRAPGSKAADDLASALADALRLSLSTELPEGGLQTRARMARYDAATIATQLREIYEEVRQTQRILVIRQGSFPDDPRVRREVEALLDRGHEVDIICLRRKGEGGREDWRGVRIFRMPLQHRRGGTLGYLLEYGLFFGMAMVAASCLHLRRRYAVVQVNTMPDLLVFSAFLPRMMGARVLLDFHELMPELYASKFASGLSHPLPRLLARIETRAAGWADACLAVSEPCLDAYTRRGASRDHFTIVMNAADPRLFARSEGAKQGRVVGASTSSVPVPVPAPAPAPTATPTPTSTPTPTHVVSHGTLTRRYGFDLLIRAMARIRDMEDERGVEAARRGPSIVLEILGDGDARPELESLIESLGLESRVTLRGFVPLDEVAGRIASFDIGVVANRSDPFTDLVVPTKLMEYASLGIPSVAARTPAVEAYFDAEMVRFFPPGDVGALADAILDMASDEMLRARLAEGAKAFVAVHGWPVQAARYVALVELLASEAR